MNFYKHHIGDYSQATAHLTFTEDAAYSRLLRKYYADERPISGPLKAAQRLVGARTKEEREAVETVLDEFFEWDAAENFWRNKRCDEELERWQAQAEANRRVAEQREQKRRERLAHGARTNRSGHSNESSHEPLNESSPSREPNQNPESRKEQKQASPVVTRENLTPARDETRPPPDRAPKPPPPNALACIAMREAGAVRVNPTHPVLLAGIAEGATPAMYGDAVREAIEAGKSEPFAYAIAAVRNRLADAARPAPTGGTHENRSAGRKRSVVERIEANIVERREREAANGIVAPPLPTRAG